MKGRICLLALLACGCQQKRLEQLQSETASVEAKIKQMEPRRPEIERLRNELAALERRRESLRSQLEALKKERGKASPGRQIPSED